MSRITQILKGKKVKPLTELESAVKYAVDHAGSGGGGSSDIVRVPFTLTVTQEGISGETDAVFADVLAERKNGKVIVAAAAMDFGSGIVQYLDGVMSGGEANDNSVLASTVALLNGDGTKLDVFDIKWKATGVTATKKEAAVS